MAKVAAYMWALGIFIAVVGQFLPGAPHGQRVVLGVMALMAAGHAISCLRGKLTWAHLPMWFHAVTTGLGLGLVGLAVAVTGGARSYLGPALICAVLFVAFFFPRRFAWPLVALLIAVAVAPLFYDADAVSVGFVPQALASVLAFTGVTFAMQRLKWRLVEAELVQRTMASQDPLTGVANRRAFDNMLSERLAPFGDATDGGERASDRLAVLFVDVDHFKEINDSHGHVTGDTVLRELAGRCATVVRPGDLFARIGGDEFALIAQGAEGAEAGEIAGRLRSVAAGIVPTGGAAPVSITVAWAAFPADGRDPSSLMRTADHRLHAEKDARYATGER
jgi:diguanylate cyclase (GGDEF)-like protein